MIVRMSYSVALNVYDLVAMDPTGMLKGVLKQMIPGYEGIWYVILFNFFIDSVLFMKRFITGIQELLFMEMNISMVVVYFKILQGEHLMELL